LRLISITLIDVPPFGDLVVPFAESDRSPRQATVVLGGGGVGKTTLMSAIASTRPGHAVSLSSGSPGAQPQAICEWTMGVDDPGRPHPLLVASPTARVLGDEKAEGLRRREQALFDKLAREGGFAFLAIPSTRWFARQAIHLSAPARTIGRYDVVRATMVEDATRADLARETKQALAYAAISEALGERRPGALDHALLGRGMHSAVNTLVHLAGYAYEGVDPASFEPVFRSETGEPLTFDALPTRARHLTALAALPVRMLWGAYPGSDPLSAEGVVAVDEVELHQELGTHGQLVATLRSALPGVQWILTASSSLVTSSLPEGEVVALRRMPKDPQVEVFTGPQARLH
jgi:hypothetical protein